MTTPSGSDRRKYWTERQGRRVNTSMEPAQARRAFSAIISSCVQRDELQEALGKDCVDGGEWGTLGDAVGDHLFIELGRDNLWPPAEHAETWDDDTFFDVIEFWFDHVSTGIDGYNHQFANCGMHYTAFTPEPARSNYRSQVNKVLARLEPSYEMGTDGEIVRSVPDGVAPLLQTAPRRLPAGQQAHVQAAITKYRARSSTVTDRRDAVRDLADVLEYLRADVKAVLSSKDEAMLFETANKFWIRHNKPDERRDYDHDAWWAWLFYIYLASIALVTHLDDREPPPTP